MKLSQRDHKRDHDFRHGRFAAFCNIARGFKHSARLHVVDFRIDDREAATTEAEHRVAFRELFGAREQRLRVEASRFRNVFAIFFCVRQELMQRRIEEADGDGTRAHRLEYLDEILALVREEFAERSDARALLLRQDHLAHGGDAFGVEEHMFGAAKADAFGAVLHGGLRIRRGFSIGAHFHAARFIGPTHERAEIAGEFWLHHVGSTQQHFAGGAIDSDDIALLHNAAQRAEFAELRIDAQIAGARHARTAHAARNDSGVAGHAAARGDDGLRGMHAVNVFGARLVANQDDLLAFACEFFGFV